MLIKAECEHCHAEFEDEGFEKTVWCPACGKETHIYAKGSDYSCKPLESDALDGVILAGYALAIILPVAGFFVGVYLLCKNQPAHGAATMAMSCVFAAVGTFLYLQFF